MQLPAWAKPDHPIVRRELNLWRRTLKRWRWLLLPLLFLPCACSALCSLTGLPIALEAPSPWLGLGLFLGWAAFMTFSFGSGIFSWLVTTFASISSATIIARERETQNWAMLRVTTLSIREIIYAKLVAIGRLLFWPVSVMLGLQIAILSLLGLIALVGLNLGAAAAPGELPPDVALGASVIILGSAPPFFLYIIFATLIGLIYNCSVGLLTSVFSRTTASAVILSFVVHFGIQMFIFVPVQQVVSIGIQLMGGLFMLVTQSPLLFLTVPLASFILPILIEVLITVAALAYSISHAQYIVE